MSYVQEHHQDTFSNLGSNSIVSLVILITVNAYIMQLYSNIKFLKCFYLQSVSGVEGPQGPPGKEGQRVSFYTQKWSMLAYFLVFFLCRSQEAGQTASEEKTKCYCVDLWNGELTAAVCLRPFYFCAGNM